MSLVFWKAKSKAKGFFAAKANADANAKDLNFKISYVFSLDRITSC